MQTWAVRARGGAPKQAGNFPDVARMYHDEVIRPVSDLVGRLLQRGIDTGEFRAVDPAYVQRIVMAPLVMLNLWMHSFDRYADAPLDPQRYLNTYVDVLLAGLVQRPHEPGDFHAPEHLAPPV